MKPEINPYAAPVVGDAPQPFAGAGVGVWRDGDEVVMHRQATLPPYCVVTGEPTACRWRVDIMWTNPGSIWTQQTKIQTPVGEGMYRVYRKRMWLAKGAFYGSCVLGPLLLITASQLETSPPFTTRLVAAVGFICALITCATIMALIEQRISRHLEFSSARGDYLWLRGPGPRFLERLPVWPYGK